MTLDNLRNIFLKALQYTPALEQKAMIDLWNKECDSIWKDKEALIKETRAACCAGISPEEIAHAKDLLAAEKDNRLLIIPEGYEHVEEFWHDVNAPKWCSEDGDHCDGCKYEMPDDCTFKPYSSKVSRNSVFEALYTLNGLRLTREKEADHADS